jgi:DNA-binding FrmR family transcriptional regulator
VGGFERKAMKKYSKKQILNRMNYLAGHLEGVKKMIKDDKYCIDIIKQNEAVIAAIKELNRIILENHLNTCVTEAIKGKDEKERKKKIKELLEIFKNSEKR